MLALTGCDEPNTSAIKTVILLSLQAQQRWTSKTERKQ
jgi:hypothetical protein